MLRNPFGVEEIMATDISALAAVISAVLAGSGALGATLHAIRSWAGRTSERTLRATLEQRQAHASIQLEMIRHQSRAQLRLQEYAAMRDEPESATAEPPTPLEP